MQISRVCLKNFRQFYGEQELVFPSKKGKNVTVIHAENGFGKTSILNAVFWCMYKKTTPKFERHDDIVHWEALSEGTRFASVEVEMIMKDTTYRIQRTFEKGNGVRDKTNLTAYRIDSGSRTSLPVPDTFVASVVPPEMAPYFFFDGEAAESFAAASNTNEIGNAVRSILGCSLADTALGDLKDVLKRVDQEIGDVADDAEIAGYERVIAELNTELETARNVEADTRDRIGVCKKHQELILESLRESAGAQEIQAQRDSKVSQRVQAGADRASCKQDILKWIDLRGVEVASKKLGKIMLDFVDEAGLRGKIPSPYNEEFVRGLLRDNVCVCHRPLPEGSPEWTAVADMLKTAGNAVVIDKYVRSRARLQGLRDAQGGAPQALASLQAKEAALRERERVLDQEIEELGKKIERLPLHDLAAKEKARRDLEKRISQEYQNLGGVTGHIVDLEKKKGDQERKLEELTRQNVRTKKLHAQRQLITKSLEALVILLKQYEEEARNKIQKELNDILERVAHKDYQCRFGDNFEIELILNERAIGKSGGENQLLSLAFIAALVKFGAERVNDDTLVLRPGTVAPLVLDAPLGQLDPMYQASVASFLPQMADQVVLLVTGSQGGDEVLRMLEPYVGAEYLLIQENRGPRGKHEEVRRTLNGKTYELVLYQQPHTMTRIERLV